jgi:hypothetical protein
VIQTPADTLWPTCAAGAAGNESAALACFASFQQQRVPQLQAQLADMKVRIQKKKKKKKKKEKRRKLERKKKKEKRKGKRQKVKKKKRKKKKKKRVCVGQAGMGKQAGKGASSPRSFIHHIFLCFFFFFFFFFCLSTRLRCLRRFRMPMPRGCR